jgi:hypothetical protein
MTAESGDVPSASLQTLCNVRDKYSMNRLRCFSGTDTRLLNCDCSHMSSVRGAVLDGKEVAPLGGTA